MNKKSFHILVLLVIIGLIILIPNASQAADKEIVLVLDPGHGGRDTGALNNGLGLVEANINLKIARYLKDYLNKYDGIKVLMTHNGLSADEKLEYIVDV